MCFISGQKDSNKKRSPFDNEYYSITVWAILYTLQNENKVTVKKNTCLYLYIYTVSIYSICTLKAIWHMHTQSSCVATWKLSVQLHNCTIVHVFLGIEVQSRQSNFLLSIVDQAKAQNKQEAATDPFAIICSVFFLTS